MRQVLRVLLSAALCAAVALYGPHVMPGQGMGPGPGVKAYSGGAGASVVGTPFTTTNPITSGAAQSTGITVVTGDVVIVMASDTGNPTQSATCSGATCTLVNVKTQAANAASQTKASMLTGAVTVGGTLSVAVTSTGGDLGFTVLVLRGLTTATPTDIQSANYASDTTPYNVTINPLVTSSYVVFWANEGGDNFVSFNPAGVTTINHNTGHYDAEGYKLNQPSGSTACGINSDSSSGTRTVIICAAMI